jgi:putative ABC transport system permease protein
VPVYDVATMEARLTTAVAQRLFVMRLLGGFACIAVLLAGIGLYGVVAHGVAQRTREVGVRVALGARRGDIVRLVLGHALALVAGGVAAGLGAAIISTRYLGSLVYGVSPYDPATLAAAAALLVIVAIVAHAMPLRRALRIDPASALRHD